MQGKPLPEDMEKHRAIRESTEEFLKIQKRKREAEEGRATEAQLEAMEYMNDFTGKRQLTDEHLASLKNTIEKFNMRCYSNKVSDQINLRKMIKSPR